MAYSCVWSETSLDPDNRSHYAVFTLVNQALDQAELGFVHRNGFAQLPADAEGAVVIVHGEHQAQNPGPTIEVINRLAWAVVIILGDDAALFPIERLSRQRRRFWVQMPVPGRHDWVDRKLICGYPHDAPAFLEHCQGLPRRFVWSFAGQVNHAFRRECVLKLRGMNDGALFETPGFWQGMPRDAYYRLLAESMFVMCPSGAATPDTMRVAEALEAGAIPVVDDRYPPGFPRNLAPRPYWEYVLDERPPFPVLRDWTSVDGLLRSWLSDYEQHREGLQLWWRAYKRRHIKWLEEDVRSVA